MVPYPPGGPLDATARVLAERVQGELGTVVVDNKPGAGGNIGMAAVAKAVPDGRTLGVAAVATLAINPWLFRKMPYDAARDFAPVTAVARVPNVLVMNAEAARQLKIASVADLIAHARENPGQLNYGSGGNGSAGHLAGELFKQQAGIEATHIPFNGANPAQLALLGGQVDFNIDNLASAAPNIKSGKLVALAVTSASPSPMLPGVPPLADTLKGFEIDTWWGWWPRRARPRRCCKSSRRLLARRWPARRRSSALPPSGPSRCPPRQSSSASWPSASAAAIKASSSSRARGWTRNLFQSALFLFFINPRQTFSMRLLHTMLRVGDLDRSIRFYTEVLGMTLLRRSENPEYRYTLAFLGYEGGNPGQAEIELTYNWGQTQYEMGTAYGHIAIGVPDARAACEKIRAAGGCVTREAGPVMGGSTVIAFVSDPDGYKIELIERADDTASGQGLR